MELNSKLKKILEYNRLYSSYYTNYPPVGEWNGELLEKMSYGDILSSTFSKKNNMREVSLYIHFPFCYSQCYFCHCHTVISKDHTRYFSFLETLEKEIKLFKNIIDNNSDIKIDVVDIHLGGGSPSGMSEKEFLYLKSFLSMIVDFERIREFSIEIDIRFSDMKKIRFFKDEGITRISFGVQDFNINVQKAINRIQSVELFDEIVPQVKEMFRGVNFDLIYGMPYQTLESFDDTIDNVIKYSPDRIALYKYNHKPDLHKHQAFIKDEWMPSEEDSILINYNAIQKLLKNGYIRVGIDHFAKVTDSLGQAAEENKLRRNFMGYTAGDYGCTIAFGPSSMGDLYGYYVQNVYDMHEYQERLDSGVLPIFRGYELSLNDIVRREVIYGIMNNFRVDFNEIKSSFNLDKNYFITEFEQLKSLIEDELITFDEQILAVTEVGKFCLRNIAIVFDDIYAKSKQYKYSKDFTK